MTKSEVRQGPAEDDSSDDGVEVTGVKQPEADQMEPEDGDGTGDLMMNQEESKQADEEWAQQSYLVASS